MTLAFLFQQRNEIRELPVPSSTAPRPGRPVRGSTSGRPIMAALDLLGRRWMLRLLWELRDGPAGPRAILARCNRLCSSVLYLRIGELDDAGLIGRSVACGPA